MITLRKLSANTHQLDSTGPEPFDCWSLLFSYETPVAGCFMYTFFRTEKYHSNTTQGHISKWLRGANAEVVDQKHFDRWLSFVRSRWHISEAAAD